MKEIETNSPPDPGMIAAIGSGWERSLAYWAAALRAVAPSLAADRRELFLIFPSVPRFAEVAEHLGRERAREWEQFLEHGGEWKEP